MHGMPVVIQSEVYVNSLVLPVPYMMCNLNRLELDDLELNGPYSNLSPDAILPHVEFDTVADRLLGLQLEYHRLLEAAAQMRGHNVSRLTLRLVVQQLLGYSAVGWGGKPTPMQWLQALKKCDTKSKQDTRRILAHGWANPPKGCSNPKVMLAFGDGQLNHCIRDAKKDDPDMHKGVVVAIGNFHPMAHFIFVCICGWWFVLLCSFAQHLGLTKVNFPTQKPHSPRQCPQLPSQTQPRPPMPHQTPTDYTLCCTLCVADPAGYQRSRARQLQPRFHIHCESLASVTTHSPTLYSIVAAVCGCVVVMHLYPIVPFLPFAVASHDVWHLLLLPQ